MLVPIPTFFNVVAFSNLSMQNSTFPRVIMLLKCCFASFSLDFTSKCSSEFGGDWWKLKSDLRSCLVSWGSDATLVTLGLETGIHKIRVDISKVEKRNKLKDPTVSGRWWCNIWVWPKPIHSPEYQINEGGAGKLEPPSFFFFFKLILT